MLCERYYFLIIYRFLKLSLDIQVFFYYGSIISNLIKEGLMSKVKHVPGLCSSGILASLYLRADQQTWLALEASKKKIAKSEVVRFVVIDEMKKEGV